MSDAGRIFVAGHQGLVGAAICRRLASVGETGLLVRTREELDLENAVAVGEFFRRFRPRQVYLAAAKVGGILDNAQHPADFIFSNLRIQLNVIDAAYRHGTQKLLFLGSSCIYPKMAPQPIEPSALLSGALEETNRAYAIAKIAGLEMCRALRVQHAFDAIAAMPTNLYGPGDTFDPERSHVIPGLMQRFATAVDAGASKVSVWGSGKPRREFLFVDDLADALVFLMEHHSSAEPVNVGFGDDVSIADLATMIAEVVGFRGEIIFDPAYPDGTPRKLLDSSVLHSLGWRPKTDLREGLSRTWHWYRATRG
jgi:GDP-L-fucose synthase